MLPAFTTITAHHLLSSSRNRRAAYSPPKTLPAAPRQVRISEHPLGCRCAEAEAFDAEWVTQVLHYMDTRSV